MDRIEEVKQLIVLSSRHTLTVDLIAHQTVLIEEFGYYSLQDYIDILKKNGINNEITDDIYNNKDGNNKNTIPCIITSERYFRWISLLIKNAI